MQDFLVFLIHRLHLNSVGPPIMGVLDLQPPVITGHVAGLLTESRSPLPLVSVSGKSTSPPKQPVEL